MGFKQAISTWTIVSYRSVAFAFPLLWVLERSTSSAEPRAEELVWLCFGSCLCSTTIQASYNLKELATLHRSEYGSPRLQIRSFVIISLSIKSKVASSLTNTDDSYRHISKSKTCLLFLILCNSCKIIQKLTYNSLWVPCY